MHVLIPPLLRIGQRGALNNFSAFQRLISVFRPFSASLLLLLFCGGCATLPKIKEVQEPQSVSAQPRIIGPKGEISSRKSKAILRRLGRQAQNTDLLQKHTALMEAITGSPLAAGNKCTLLIDGRAAIASMLEGIEGARDHVNFETYIFEDGETGRVFADLLLRKQAEGVQVNLIYDSVGCRNVPSSFFQRLRGGGIQVLEFNPINPFKTRHKWLLTNRDHRKILIVDGRIAFTGGVNISDASSGSLGKYRSGDSREPWRDTHVRVEGPAVAELQKLFIETWTGQKGPELAPRDYFPPLEKMGDDLVRVLGTVPGGKLPATYLMYLAAFTYAAKTIHLTSAYFVPDDESVEALQKAAARGVDVRIVLPGSSDIGVVFYAGRSYYTRLLKSGVRLYERRGSVLHAKTAVVDGVWSTVGSTNMDLWSFVRNNEVNTIILGRHFAEEMETLFEQDLMESNPIVLEDWRNRGVSERLKEWVTRLFRHFL